MGETGDLSWLYSGGILGLLQQIIQSQQHGSIANPIHEWPGQWAPPQSGYANPLGMGGGLMGSQPHDPWQSWIYGNGSLQHPIQGGTPGQGQTQQSGGFWPFFMHSLFGTPQQTAHPL